MTVRLQRQSAFWPDQFMGLLPVILGYLKPAFRQLRPEARAEAVQEGIANAYQAFHRLMLQGRASLIFPTVLARFAIAQIRAGRKVGVRLNSQDVSSSWAQRQRGFLVSRLDHYDADEGSWVEAVVEDYRTPVAEQVCFRLDFAAWLQTLPRRHRKIAEFLAQGHRACDAARHFRISCGRISQLRKEFYLSWQTFHGENEPPQAESHTPVTAKPRLPLPKSGPGRPGGLRQSPGSSCRARTECPGAAPARRAA